MPGVSAAKPRRANELAHGRRPPRPPPSGGTGGAGTQPPYGSGMIRLSVPMHLRPSAPGRQLRHRWRRSASEAADGASPRAYRGTVQYRVGVQGAPSLDGEVRTVQRGEGQRSLPLGSVMPVAATAEESSPRSGEQDSGSRDWLSLLF